MSGESQPWLALTTPYGNVLTFIEVNSPDTHHGPYPHLQAGSALVTSLRRMLQKHKGEAVDVGRVWSGKCPAGGATSTESGGTGVGQRKWDGEEVRVKKFPKQEAGGSWDAP